MSDRMRVLPFPDLLEWILKELESQRSIFGIPRELFFVPRDDAPFVTTLFGHTLASPIGPAAGPHTQLTQNILSAWLVGGRFIELKTVQILDELEIPRPCIDMEDEGYNVEWSQELRLAESADEYVKAWALIHVLRRALGFETTSFGTIFNMSVGYNLEGILSEPLQHFMDRLEDASEALAPILETLRERCPQFADLEIPSHIADSVTLSTMHGCPPDEIERIGRYLIEERGLHTLVKLNPTPLGEQRVREILHERLGYREIDIPASVFAHDLQYERAIELIRALRDTAASHHRVFGVKLSNTLAMANHRGTLPGEEMYMSGRALYPITMQLFRKLVEDLGDDLRVSYSAGGDAFNLADLLSAGALPVTVASDLLKPGGYLRMAQYSECLAEEMAARGAHSLVEFAERRAENLARAAGAALDEPRYKKSYHPHGLPKVESPLDLFDCIEAPCVAPCAVHQNVPEYAYWIARQDDALALAAILHRNPLPGVTGYVCTHLCQTRCTRNSYDQSVAIRRLKRFAFEHGDVRLSDSPSTDFRIAVIGSGPSGLAAAFFLALNGVGVTIFEAKDRAGGMLAIAPTFRLPDDVVRTDIARIERLGVTIECNHPIETPPEQLLEEGFDAVYVACGFAADAGLKVEGNDATGVYGALDFLARVAHGTPPALGERVVVIGGGNTAMDAARTAQRLTGRPSTVLYRRSREEMPTEMEEITALLEEGNELIELATPLRVMTQRDRIVGLECVRNRLGEPGEDGRRRPTPIEGGEFEVLADTVVLATGQRTDTPFLEGSRIVTRSGGRIEVDAASGRTAHDRIYAGGDITRGPSVIIEACADGRRAAEAICEQLHVPFAPPPLPDRTTTAKEIRRWKVARARKSLQYVPPSLDVAQRGGFVLVEETLSEAAARAEAKRCLQCHLICDRCVDVCPNRANVAIETPTVDIRLPILAFRDGNSRTIGEETVAIRQRRQIVHLDDLCNECGNCATFCTHQGKPYLDKPRLFLTRAAFEAHQDNAFYLDEETIHRREGGEESRLARIANGYLYEAPGVRVRFDPDFHVEGSEPTGAPEDGPVSLRAAVEMAVLLDGLTGSAPYLPLEPKGGTL